MKGGAASLVGYRLMPWLIDRIALPLRLAAPLKAMTADEPMRKYFATDPLLGRMRVASRFFRTMHARKAGELDLGCPLLLVHPGADAWTPTAVSRQAFQRVKGPKAFVELTNGSHLPAERSAIDELQREVQRFLAGVVGAGGREEWAALMPAQDRPAEGPDPSRLA